MKLEHVLLGVLARRASTGYDLKKYLDSHGRFLRSNTQMSQVYRSLGRMESDGWIRHSVEPRPGATDAKTFGVTSEGITVFLDWLTGPYQPPTRFQDPEFQARISFAGFMTRDQLVRLLDIELTTRSQEVARYRDRDRWLPVETDTSFDPDLAELVGEWSHLAGAAAMDEHLRRVRALRNTILDAQESTPADELLSRLSDELDRRDRLGTIEAGATSR